MSAWTHAICSRCFAQIRPARVPSVVLGSPEEHCCFCGEKTREGIYLRWDPRETRCEGRHPPGGELS